MPRHLIIAALGSLLCMPAAAQRPTPEEQKHTLDTAREIAIHYTSKLPDFICTEQVERTDRTSQTNIKVDRLTIQLTYFGQKEKQKLVAMNGQKTEQSLESLDGLITGGEFGSLLLGAFDPSSSADFQWKESSTVRKRRAAVYTYRIARANSHYIVGHRDADGKMVRRRPATTAKWPWIAKHPGCSVSDRRRHPQGLPDLPIFRRSGLRLRRRGRALLPAPHALQLPHGEVVSTDLQRGELCRLPQVRGGFVDRLRHAEAVSQISFAPVVVTRGHCHL